MTKNEKHWLISLLITYLLFALTLLFSVIMVYMWFSKKIYIKYLPNIEKDFFNGFIVGGNDIYDKAYVTSKYLIFPFGKSLYEPGPYLLTSIIVILAIFVYLPLASLRLRSDVFKRTFFWFNGVILLPFIILMGVGFALPMNINTYTKVFDQQIYRYFGEDFFHTQQLQEQLDIFRSSVVESFGFSKGVIFNSLGMVFVLLSSLAIVYCMVKDVLIIKNLKNMDDLAKLEIPAAVEVSEEDIWFSSKQVVNRKYFFVLLLFTSILTISTIVLFFMFALETFKLSEIPFVGKEYFNGFIDQGGRRAGKDHLRMEGLLTSFWFIPISSWKFKFFLTFLPLWGWASVNVMFIHKYYKGQVNNGLIFWVNIFLIIFLVNICLQLSGFLSFRNYENFARNSVYADFEKNYLIKTIGLKTLESQINDTAKGLQSLIAPKYDAFVISQIVLIAITIGVAMTWNTAYLLKKDKDLNPEQIPKSKI
ncbi:hypothetical protein [Spiroplasma alleghenense]|uniref:Transmembrane protein n=1 Tax=Spiroplasma alleghenense TaxID=216931 RepID=A0A345Z4Q0_9MOLU|nr:hypothetical protein [Spiroplasma alleghenense]AXK51579.1 hypothetical protein SALLE_v1c09090 [Spiroplasma alleghenense]